MSDLNSYTNYNTNQFTFHTNFPPPTFMPPPPVPPQFFIPPFPAPQSRQYVSEPSDQDFVKSFESRIASNNLNKYNLPPISETRQQLRDLVLTLNELKDKGKMISEKVNSLKEQEWLTMVKQVESNKAKIDQILSQINDQHLDNLRKAIAKRAAKRLRMKRIRTEKKREKDEWIKECKEKSRRIDENLQKIKNEIEKSKQEEEAKLQADSVLKDVLRKKNDAKKCLVKLDALMKLRKARQNTAKGRGENVSEKDAISFNNNIEKLMSLWKEKLTAYEKEESDLRSKLKQEDIKENTADDSEKEVMNNLSKWRECMFGRSEILPQYNFNGDVGKFVALRLQWDQYISTEGSSLPVGWVTPAITPKLS